MMNAFLRGASKLALLPALATVPACAAAPEPDAAVVVPFDPAGQHIKFPATIKGRPVVVIVDTGLNPSGVALSKAEELGLPIDRNDRVPLSGVGEQEVFAYAGAIEDLVIGGRRFDRLSAMADPGPAFQGSSPERRFDAILGYNFLEGGIFLVDYVRGAFSILANAGAARPQVQTCRKTFEIPLRSYAEDTIPIIPDFQIGPISGPVSLDTGAGTPISLYQAAMVPSVEAVLPPGSPQTVTGARGATTLRRVVLPFEIGFGPFRVKAQEALLSRQQGSKETRIANVGNQLFRALKLKMLLDYRSRRIVFYGDCGA